MASQKNGPHPHKARTAVEALITGVALAAALVLLNVLTCGARARVDLTAGGIYSLSPASKNLVASMKEKIHIKGIFGNVPSEYADKVSYVDMLLSEYADRSNGKIVYERIDPWDKPELQDELRKDGVEKLRLQSLKDDAFEQVPMYFHVIFSHLDKKEVWTPAQGFALEGLEYDFTTRIKRLGFGKKKVGVTQGFGEPERAQVLTAPGGLDVVPGVKLGLGDLYDVTPVNWKDKPASIDDVDVLVVNGPTEKVSDAAKYRLDQAIMKGKPVLFLVGGMRWQAGGGQQIPGMEDPEQPYVGMPNDPGLFDQLESYGFKIDKDVILDGRNSGPVLIPPGMRNGLLVTRGLAPFAESLQRGEKEMLAGIDVIALPLPSSMSLVGALADPSKDPDLKLVKLLQTSPNSWRRDEVLAITRELNVKPADDRRGPFLVGAAVSGKFKSFFADKSPPAGIELAAAQPAKPAEGEGETEADKNVDKPEGDKGADKAKPAVPAAAGQLKDSVSHTRMIVISAPSIAEDTTLVDLIYVNGFVGVHNMVDWLSEDTDLIAVRSKKPERPIDKLESGTRSLVKYGNVIGAPLILVLAGLFTWRVRERRRRNVRL